MKIVHINLTGPVTDGWNYQDNMLTKYHKKLGNDVVMITSEWIWDEKGCLVKDKRKKYVNRDGVEMIRLSLKGKDRFEKKLKRYIGLEDAIDSCSPDILFIHNVAFMDTGIIAKYLKNHKNVVAFADNHADFSNSGRNVLSRYILQGGIWRHYAKKLIPFVDTFYGVLPARVEYLSSIYKIPSDKCKLLLMGADDDLVNEARDCQKVKMVREQYNVNQEDFLIVSGGKIDAAKKQTLHLMEAVKRINKDNVKLLVFGSIDKELQETANKLIDGTMIKYIGWIDAKETYNLFGISDLVVFPGRHSVFWEQVVALGKPMVVKDWEGTHHIDIGGNVLFLKHDSVDEIETILKLLLIPNSEQYLKMKDKAESEHRTEFLYGTIAKKSIELER